jgi:hypothetical protein
MKNASERIRTSDHPLRRRVLYPTELRMQTGWAFYSYFHELVDQCRAERGRNARHGGHRGKRGVKGGGKDY